MIMPIGQNTLSSVNHRALYTGTHCSFEHPGSGADKVKALQLRQQQLQNTMLLMKASGSDSSSLPEETQEILQKKLDEVSLDLRAAKAEAPRQEMAETAPQSRVDRYEMESREMDAPGIYQIAKNTQGYEISFMPYREA